MAPDLWLQNFDRYFICTNTAVCDILPFESHGACRKSRRFYLSTAWNSFSCDSLLIPLKLFVLFVVLGRQLLLKWLVYYLFALPR